MNLAQNVCLDDFLVVRNLVTWGQKLGHYAKSNLFNIYSGHMFEVILNLVQNIYFDFYVKFGTRSLMAYI